MSEDKKLTMSFINGNPGFVVKADDAVELDQLLAAALPIFRKFKTAVDTYREKQQNDAATLPGQTTQNPPTCGIHKTQMKWLTGVSKKTGRPYAFWSCPTKNPDGSYCEFKPQ